MKEYADYLLPKDIYGENKFHKGFACYESHPVLMLGGGMLAGGSCIHPVHHDADIYIGLDHGMRVLKYWPWEVNREITQFLYPIIDGRAPSDPKSFTRLVEYVCNQLQLGKKVHVGCIGGHGRTGTLLVAVFAVLNNDKDAIETVRKLYCKKAVETSSQVEFLHKYFGVNLAPASEDNFQHLLHTKVVCSHQVTPQKSSQPPLKLASNFAKDQSTVFSTATKTWHAVDSTRRLIGVLF